MPRRPRVLGTGVRLEADPGSERDAREAIAPAREPAHTLRASVEGFRHGEHLYVRAVAFVDVELDGESHRWEWTPSHPEAVPLGRPATSRLVDLARGVEAQTRGALLADARLAGLRVGRWEVESAPRRIELDSALAAQLVLD
jgi:hypothetical protein